jgi:hypothetical protein
MWLLAVVAAVLLAAGRFAVPRRERAVTA